MWSSVGRPCISVRFRCCMTGKILRVASALGRILATSSIRSQRSRRRSRGTDLHRRAQTIRLPIDRTKKLLAVALVCVLVSDCGGGSGGSSPTAPGSSTIATPNPCTSSQTCPSIDSIGFWVRIYSNTFGNPGGPWSFTFLDKTYSGTGDAEYGFIQVAVGDYQISGQFSTDTFTVVLGRQGGGKGGIVPSSVQSVEGPLAPSDSCAAAYHKFGQSALTTPQTFRIKFTVIAGNSNTSC